MVDPSKFNDPNRLRIPSETDAYGRTRIKPRQNMREFNEIMKDKAKEEKEEEEEAAGLKKSKPTSIFDLQPQATAKDTGAASAAATAAAMQQSMLQQTTLAKEQEPEIDPSKLGRLMAEAGSDLAGTAMVLGKKTEESIKGMDFTQAREDLTYINPMGIPTAGEGRPQSVNASPAQPVAQTQTLQQIVDQIVDKLYTLKTDGRTETILTVKNPPILAGSEIVVSGFDSARGQFNVAFHNLGAEALRMLQVNATQIGLRQALEDKGFTIQMFIVTAQPYTPVVKTETAQNERQQRDNQGEGRDQQGGRQGQGQRRG